MSEPTVIELVDDTGDHRHHERPSSPRRRRAIILGVLAAALVALVVVAVVGESDDGTEADLTADLASTVPELTAPDTLPPVSALSPDSTSPPDPTPPTGFVANDPLSERPTDWPIINAEVSIDLEATIASIVDDEFVSAQTFVEQPGFSQRIDITTVNSDTTRSRDASFAISIETAGLDERVVIVDDDGYVRREPGRWETFAVNDAVRFFWRRLLVGPLQGDTAGDADDGNLRPVVAIERADRSGRTPARALRFETTVAALPGWTPYALGPQAESLAVDGDQPVELLIAVAADGDLVEYRWSIPFGSDEQSVVHRVWNPETAPPDIAAPKPDHIDGPATNWIVVPR